MADDKLAEHFDNAADHHVKRFCRQVFFSRSIEEDIQLGGELILSLPVINQDRNQRQGSYNKGIIGGTIVFHR